MKKTVLFLIAFELCFTVRVQAAETNSGNPYLSEAPAQHDARMEWFREARFGMFIHWGLYAQAAGEWDAKPDNGAGEWIMNNRQIPASQYKSLVPQFNPVTFDARA